jgi:hypothetical protein
MKLELAPSASSPPDLKSLLGPPPLLEGEDAGAYDALYGQIRTAVAPRDVLEEIWARDVIDNLWETLRLRRLKVRFMRAAAHEGLASLLHPLRNDILNFGLDRSLADRWAGRELAAINEVDGLLKEAGLDQEAIAAQTLALKLDTIERIERMIMQTEGRRNMMLREIDRHRDVLAQRLREAATEIEDAEFEEIPSAGAAE